MAQKHLMLFYLKWFKLYFEDVGYFCAMLNLGPCIPGWLYEMGKKIIVDEVDNKIWMRHL